MAAGAPNLYIKFIVIIILTAIKRKATPNDNVTNDRPAPKNCVARQGLRILIREWLANISHVFAFFRSLEKLMSEKNRFDLDHN